MKRSERRSGGAGSATSSAALAAKGGGGEQNQRPGSSGRPQRSSGGQQSSRAVCLARHDGIRGRRAARGLRKPARWWKTNFGNWIKFDPPPPKCAIGEVAQSVTGVAQKAARDRGAGGRCTATGVADGDSRSPSVAEAALGRCDPVSGGVNLVGTKTSRDDVWWWDVANAVARMSRGGGLIPTAEALFQNGWCAIVAAAVLMVLWMLQQPV